MVHTTADVQAAARTAKPPPAKIWQASDPPFQGYQAADPSGWQKSNADTAIVIDNGMALLRRRRYQTERLIGQQAARMFAPGGHLTTSHDIQSLRFGQNTRIES